MIGSVFHVVVTPLREWQDQLSNIITARQPEVPQDSASRGTSGLRLVGYFKAHADGRHGRTRMVRGISELRDQRHVRVFFFLLVNARVQIDDMVAWFSRRHHIEGEVSLAVKCAQISSVGVIIGQIIGIIEIRPTAAFNRNVPLRSDRMTLTFDMNNTPNTLNDYIVPVDASLLKRQDLIGLDDVISEIDGGWPSLEVFEDRGFGCVAIQSTDEGLTIISWCLTDWVVGSECEVGIQTEESYRGNGWARETLLGALLLAKQKGITRVGWQCWSNNIGSQRTAMSVGFKLLADFPVLFGWNHPLNNFLVNGNHYAWRY